MGKKGKVGKDRKDKFYKLAKETGFRSRAAFKLIQLNRKFNFLQQSQVCIDLCAAPGGWMQVAKQTMPVSSIVIGVDLFPIRPIVGCIGLVEDITTEKCRVALTKELQTWKADVVLHDGAPNVGKNWLYDAYQQICLTLNSVKLATQFLRAGGWFVTKVFRSKDYNALMWVLKQLFKKVHATKPSASRKESAEIFVVCQYFIAPDKIDQRFFEPKYVFEELDLEGTKQVSLLHPEKKRIKAEGYSENDFSLRHELLVSEFIKHTNALIALQNVGEIVFDDLKIKKHPKTTDEIIECCKDIKVLGRKDLRSLIAWWKTLRAEFYPKVEVKDIAENDAVEKKVLTQEEVEDMEFEELERQILDLEVENEKDQKRKKKKVQEERRKLNEKLNLKMVIKGDAGPQEEDAEVFSLRQIGTAADLDRIQDVAPDMILDDGAAENTEYLAKYKKYDSEKFHLDDDGLYEDNDEEKSEHSDDDSDSDDSAKLGKKGLGLGGSDDENNSDADKKADSKKSKNGKGVKKVERTKHPLITDLDHRDKGTKRDQRVNLWFEKDNLREAAENDADEDFDLDKLSHQYKTKGVKVFGEDRDIAEKVARPPLGKKALRRERHKQAGSDGNASSSDSDSDDDTAGKVANGTKKIRLNEQELALGAMMIRGQKVKRDLFDAAWNRYTFNDEHLPEWFVEDENVHMRKEAPVPKELQEEYQNKVEELNVRPIKKVMEAKARKKRRAMKRFDKAKKKAEAIMESADATSQEKMRQIRKLYKKAQDKKEDISYVVTKKHLASKRVRRPAGVKGRFKVVDPRMKKEKRAMKARDKRSNRKR